MTPIDALNGLYNTTKQIQLTADNHQALLNMYRVVWEALEISGTPVETVGNE